MISFMRCVSELIATVSMCGCCLIHWGGQFTLCMHPEQAEQMAYRILALAREARAERAANYPGFYPVEKGKVVDG